MPSEKEFHLKKLEEIYPLFSSLEDSHLQEWIDRIDHSPYSLEAWVEALVCFDEWLKKNDKNAQLIGKLEYIQCSIEGQSMTQNALPELQVVVLYYLNQFGYKT